MHTGRQILHLLFVGWDLLVHHFYFRNSYPVALHCIFLNENMVHTIWGLTFNVTINKPFIHLTACPQCSKNKFLFWMTDDNMRSNIYFWPVWIKCQTCYLLSDQRERTQTHHRLDDILMDVRWDCRTLSESRYVTFTYRDSSPASHSVM